MVTNIIHFLFFCIFYSIRPKKTAEFLKDAVELRLRMLIPYIDIWPQVYWDKFSIMKPELQIISVYLCALNVLIKRWTSFCLYRLWASCYCPITSPTAWSTCLRWWMTSGTTQVIAQQTWVAPLIQNQHLFSSLHPLGFSWPPMCLHSAYFHSTSKARFLTK